MPLNGLFLTGDVCPATLHGRDDNEQANTSNIHNSIHNAASSSASCLHNPKPSPARNLPGDPLTPEAPATPATSNEPTTTTPLRPGRNINPSTPAAPSASTTPSQPTSAVSLRPRQNIVPTAAKPIATTGHTAAPASTSIHKKHKSTKSTASSEHKPRYTDTFDPAKSYQPVFNYHAVLSKKEVEPKTTNRVKVSVILPYALSDTDIVLRPTLSNLKLPLEDTKSHRATFANLKNLLLYSIKVK